MEHKTQQELTDQLFSDLQQRINGPLTPEDAQIIKDWMSTKELKQVPPYPIMCEYKIMQTSELDEFNTKTQDLLQEGWCPMWNVITYEYDDTIYFVQQFSRPKPAL